MDGKDLCEIKYGKVSVKEQMSLIFRFNLINLETGLIFRIIFSR
jgi:hypothetical protein